MLNNLRRRLRGAGAEPMPDQEGLDGAMGAAGAVDNELAERKRPTLVDTGKHTGQSRVQYRGYFIPLHLITKDFFISMVQLDTYLIVLIVAAVYLFFFFFWSIIWYLIVRYYPSCVYGATTYIESLIFATVTQMTIGYGNSGPKACWAAGWLIIIQSIIGVLLEAVVLGIVFARISHPHQRSRSIFMSDKAIVARRDGILKFMFRVADIRNTQVVEPKVKAYLYTWGQGRITAEGERIPVRVEPLDVDYIDGMLLLPLIIEHTIDERSPLCGHTHTSLVSLNAEIVVTFEGTTEMGNPFMARRSYTPEEIFWGHQFVNIVDLPHDAAGHYEIDLENFHKVERQEKMPNLYPMQLSQLVVNRAKRTVPYPLLGENTLVLSDVLCLAPNEDGLLTLYCRVGDTYPNQMLEITAKMLLYRWKNVAAVEAVPGPAPEGEAFELFALHCGYDTGEDRLHLRLPVLLEHVIDVDSPLSNWREPGGFQADEHSEIIVVINAYMNVNNNNVLRQRTYTCNHHVRFGYGFTPIVKHPGLARDGKPRVRWQHFHAVQPAEGMEDYPALQVNASGDGGMTAPESHANLRTVIGNSRSTASLGGVAIQQQQANMGYGGMLSNMERNDFTVLPMDLQRYAAAVGGDASQVTGSPRPPTVLFPDIILNYAEDTTDASNSLPHPAALHPALPGIDRFRLSDAAEEMNDYTVAAADLSRYSAAIARADTLPRSLRAPSSFTPLPAGMRKSTPPKTSPKHDEAAAAASQQQEHADDRQHVAFVSGPIEEKISEGSDERDGPLAGVHPIERTMSHAFTGGDNSDEEGAGPMHFATSKARLGAKSLKEISTLFNTEPEDDDLTPPPS